MDAGEQIEVWPFTGIPHQVDLVIGHPEIAALLRHSPLTAYF
jgi:hypothetical protein